MRHLSSLCLVAVLVLATVSVVFAQPTAIIKVLGVSDRDVARDTTDIYTRSSSGLANVGVGEMVYLAGNPDDEDITDWIWELELPNNSDAELNTDDSSEVYFVPDILGTFRVTLRVTNEEGESEPVTMPINSANWVGVGGMVGNPRIPQCAVCHGNKAEEWSETGHASFFTEAIDGIVSGYYNSSCIRCHTVGYDADEMADNNGFDDLAAEHEWVFPDTLMEGNWEAMVDDYPEVAAMANIQCEMCHGPGSAHRGNTDDNRMVTSMDVGACSKCHDSGTHHTRPYQWDFSGHANPTRYPTGEGRESCVRCHGGYGFVDYINGVEQDERRTDYLPITCAVCHDPHDAANDHQLRTVDAYTLENDVEVDLDLGNICVNCHHSRRNADEYVEEYHSHYGPHHSNQTDMLVGTNAIEYDQDIPSSPHAMAVENGCVGCHMAEGPGDEDEGYLEVGDHTFAMVSEDGVENVAACAACHGEIESFESIMADEDWDGDNNVESIEAEIEGLMATLALLLPPYNEPEVAVDTNYTAAQLKAAYNYLFVEEDGSHGLHNAAYARGILEASIADPALEVEQGENFQPFEWKLGEPYPNPFNPSTTFSYSLAENGLVTIKLYSLSGREVMTVLQDERMAGIYEATVNLANFPSGIYIIRLQARNFNATRKIVLMK